MHLALGSPAPGRDSSWGEQAILVWIRRQAPRGMGEWLSRRLPESPCAYRLRGGSAGSCGRCTALQIRRLKPAALCADAHFGLSALLPLGSSWAEPRRLGPKGETGKKVRGRGLFGWRHRSRVDSLQRPPGRGRDLVVYLLSHHLLKPRHRRLGARAYFAQRHGYREAYHRRRRSGSGAREP